MDLSQRVSCIRSQGGDGTRRASALPSMSRRVYSTLGLAVLLATGTASASAPRPPPSLAHLRVTGEAVLRDVSVTVRCHEPDRRGHAAHCRVSATYELGALGTVMLRAQDTWPDEEPPGLQLDGKPFHGASAERTLSEGERVRVVIEDSVELTAGHRFDGWPRSVRPHLVRHPVLGRTLGPWHEEDVDGALAKGSRIHVEGPIQADVEPGPARISIGGQVVSGVRELEVPRPTVQVSLSAGPPEDTSWGPVRHGGPVLGFGSRRRYGFPEDGGDSLRFLLRAGYELAFFDYLFASVWFETDFDSIMEVLLVEVASPELMVFVPSFSAGVGAVARQLGPRDADAALRLHVGGNILLLGISGDFDYWPAIGEWTASLSARISI